MRRILSPCTALALALIGLAAPARAIVFGGDCGERLPGAVAVVIDVTADGGAGPVRTVAAHCSGVFVRRDVVLTAAHCLDAATVVGDSAAVSAARFFASRAADLQVLSEVPPDAVAVSGAFVLPGYVRADLQTATGINNDLSDLGLLFFAAAVVEDADVVAVDAVGDVDVGAAVVTAGYGVVDVAQPESSRGRRTCGDAFVGAVGAFELQVGAGSGSVRGCDGDSGGPLVGAAGVIAVHSHVLNALGCQAPSVAARVAPHVAALDAAAIAACDDGVRSDCDPAGLVAVVDVDAGVVDVDAGVVDAGVVDADAGVVVDAGAGVEVEDPGCAGCGAAVVVVVSARRRRRGAA